MGWGLSRQPDGRKKNVVFKVDVDQHVISHCAKAFEEGPPGATCLRGGLKSVGKGLDMAQYGTRLLVLMLHTGDGAREERTMAAQYRGKENLFLFGHVVAQLDGEVLDRRFQCPKARVLGTVGSVDLGCESLEPMKFGVKGFVVANEDMLNEIGKRFLVPTYGALCPSGLLRGHFCEDAGGKQGDTQAAGAMLCAGIREGALTATTKVEAVSLEDGDRARMFRDQLGEGADRPRLGLWGRGVLDR